MNNFVRGSASLAMVWRRRGGFTIIEMIAMVGLLAIFMVVISALFKAAYRGQVDSERRGAVVLRVDAAIGMLRRDVWGARAMELRDGELMLSEGEGTVRWRLGNVWSRTETGERELVRRWEEMPAEGAVEVRGALVTARFSGVKVPLETVTFVSQVMMGGGR